MANNPENLIPNSERTPEQLREQTRKGGIASGEARRKKKVMTEIYAKWLEQEHDIEIDKGNREKLTGTAALNRVMGKIVERCDNVTVSIMKEIRETIEGQKVESNISTDFPLQIVINGVKPEQADEN